MDHQGCIGRAIGQAGRTRGHAPFRLALSRVARFVGRGLAGAGGLKLAAEPQQLSVGLSSGLAGRRGLCRRAGGDGAGLGNARADVGAQSGRALAQAWGGASRRISFLRVARKGIAGLGVRARATGPHGCGVGQSRVAKPVRTMPPPMMATVASNSPATSRKRGLGRVRYRGGRASRPARVHPLQAGFRRAGRGTGLWASGAQRQGHRLAAARHRLRHGRAAKHPAARRAATVCRGTGSDRQHGPRRGHSCSSQDLI